MALFLIFLQNLFSDTNNTPERPGPAEDFAGKIAITGNSGSLLRFEIPEELYRGLKRPDMGDIRIYDSQGNPAPFLVRSPKKTITIPPEKPVPILVWDEKSGRFTSSSPGIEITVSGSAVTINPSGGAARNSEEGGLYLADLSAFKADGPRPSKLVLDFLENKFFNAAVSIRKSNDLSRWEDHGPIQTASFYNNPGTDRNEFDIPPARYILLDFNGKIPPVNQARVRFDPLESPAALRKTVFTGTKDADGKKVYYYTEGCFPLQKLFFNLSRPDSIRVSIRNRSTEQDHWQYCGETTVYRIEAPGKESVANEPIDVFHRGSYWELTISGEQVWTEVPAMELLWEPLEIVFLARGAGPWTLAYGNSEYEPQRSPLDVQDQSEIFPAVLGPASYSKPEEPGTERWKQGALWAILGLAAAILSGLALYIIKSMNNGE
jgi:hypothetical protein